MKKFALIVLCTFGMIVGARAQGFNAQGIVVDNTGEPVIGATIIVKGTQTGAISNYDGSFTINAPNAQSVLQFSFLGFEPQEATVSAGMRITLQPSAGEIIPDVVVTGMYVTDKRLFTGATDRLVGDDVKIDGMSEISRALEGRSAGVSIQNVSGTFGSAPKIRVRGATSILGDSKPLWVVDGIVMEDLVEVSADDLSSGNAETLVSSAIAGLSADDIEDIQVLKDGSATSIYGARAMAGVIVVTTKRGQAGHFRFNYTGEFTMRMLPSYNQFNIMNSQEQMGIYQELQDKGHLNFAGTVRANSSGVYGKMYSLLDTYNTTNGMFGIPNTEEARTKYLRQAEYRNTDWFKELFNVNVMHSHAISMSGGSEKATFYTSASALVDPGWTKASDMERFTANLNGTFNILKNFSVTLMANASHRTQTAPGTTGQAIDPVAGVVSREFDINPYSYAINTSRTLDPNEFYTRNYAPFNIKHELENNYIDLSVTDVKFQTELKWKIIPGLEWSAVGAIKYSRSSMEHNIKDNSNQALAYRAMGDATIIGANRYLYSDPDHPFDLPITILPQGGIYNRTDNSMSGYDFQTSLSWNKVFADKHIVNAFATMVINSNDRKETWFRGWGRLYEENNIPFYIYQLFKESAEEGTNYYSFNESRMRQVAFAGTVTYSYDAKYVINGTIRYEGSNQLGRARQSRWLPTWNVSGAWNAHEENFFRAIRNVMSRFTLRASYSLTANRGIASNARAIIMSHRPWRPSADSQEVGLIVSETENSDLTYEKKHELNIGVDMGFLDDRISVGFDWYMRDNFDLIGPTTTDGVGGAGLSPLANVAAMRTGGAELSIMTRNIVRPNNGFNWGTTFIFAYNYTKITDLDSYAQLVELVTGTGFGKEGYPHRALFSIPFDGLREDGTPRFIINNNGDRSYPGNSAYFQARDNLEFLKYEGPIDPTITGSLGNMFSYKGFKLNVFITYSFGNKIRLYDAFRSGYSDLDASPREFADRYVSYGDERHTNIPVILDKFQTTNSGWAAEYTSYNNSDVRVADGGFIRMKEISLSYDFPENLYSVLRMSSLSLKLSATNPFLIYSDKKLQGQDPEFFSSGGVAAPVPRQFTLTLRIGF